MVTNKVGPPDLMYLVIPTTLHEFVKVRKAATLYSVQRYIFPLVPEAVEADLNGEASGAVAGWGRLTKAFGDRSSPDSSGVSSIS